MKLLYFDIIPVYQFDLIRFVFIKVNPIRKRYHG